MIQSIEETPQGRVTYQLLPIDKMLIEHEVNTRTVRPRLREMIADWHPEECRALDVAPKESAWSVIDGATRFLAMRELHIPTAMCRIHWWAETPAQRAQLFRALTKKTTGIRAIDDFRAMVTEGDRHANAVAAAVAERGWTVTSVTFKVQPNAISCTDALLQVEEWSVLAPTLATIAKAWPADPNGRREALVLAIGAVLKAYGDGVAGDRLAERLAMVSPVALVAKARNAATSELGSLYRHTFKQVVQEYNKRLATRRLTDMQPPRCNYRRPMAGGGQPPKLAGRALSR